MSVQMDETFAAALRDVLVTHVQPQPVRRVLRHPQRAAAAGLGLALLTGGGVAVASGLLPLPGAREVTHLAPPVTVSATGTQAVELGKPPAGATGVDIKLTCLTAGTFRTADGASLTCTDASVDSPSDTMLWDLRLAPGEHRTTVTAEASARWRLVATYSRVSTTAWGVNSHGQTYGVVNERGAPDLVAVVATNGRTGYAYANQLQEPPPMSPSEAVARQTHRTSKTVPVYEVDGRTVIGEFQVG